jgi:hypothetical protein
MKVTNQHVHDSKALPELVDDIIKSDNTTTSAIGKLFADGAYDNNDIFRYLSDNGILSCIKVRKNARIKLKKGKTSLEIYRCWHKDMICKSGKTAKAMESGGLLKLFSLV